MVELVLFVLMAAGAVFGSIAVITARNPVHSAMGLLGTLLSLAVLYVVNLAHLVAAVQVIVYAGAVMTLFLFVIMLIGVDRQEDTSETIPFQRQLVVGLALVVVLLGAALTLGHRLVWVPAAPAQAAVPNGTVQAVAEPLFTEWVLPFEVTALLLTIAAAGTIALAFFRRGRGEEQGEAS